MQRTGIVAAITASIVVLLAGCGGMGSVGGEGHGAEGASAGKPIKVKFAQSSTEISALFTVAADKKGFLKEQGLDVEFIEVSGTAKVVAALAAGDVQFGQSTMPGVLAVAEKGQQILGIVNFFDRYAQLGVVHKAALPAGMTPEAFHKLPVLDRIRALKGKNLGIAGQGGLAEIVTRSLLKSAGVDPEKDVVLVALGGSALLGALQQKQIDAYLLSAPGPVQAVADGYGVIYLDGALGEIAALSNFPTTGVMTTPEFAEKNPEAVKRVATAFAKAMDWAVNNQQDAVKLMQAQFPKLDPGVVEQSVLGLMPALSKHGRYNADGIKGQMEMLLAAGDMKKPVDITEGVLWTNKFLPN